MAKEPDSLIWIEELLPAGYLRKPMFGGFGYYLDEKMIMAIFENAGDRTHKGKSYDYDVWNGCLFPAEREHHMAIQNLYPFLSPHPVLSKWLYIPVQNEDFEASVESILKEIRRRSKLFGVIPKPKKQKQPKKSKELKTNIPSGRPGARFRPMMFADEPPDRVLSKAKKISDLKNLGPASEKALFAAGIKTVNQFVKLGWKKSLKKLVDVDPKNCHSVFTYALIGALTNTDWNRISEKEKLEAKIFTAGLRNKKAIKN